MLPLVRRQSSDSYTGFFAWVFFPGTLYAVLSVLLVVDQKYIVNNPSNNGVIKQRRSRARFACFSGYNNCTCGESTDIFHHWE
jgi:hypothetical protein